MTSQLSEDIIKQPQVQPPDATMPIKSPSIIVYLILLLVSICCLYLANLLGKSDYPGFFINLSAGFIQTIIILIFVDERLRKNELSLFGDFAVSIFVRITAIFSKDVANTINYNSSLHHQIQIIFPKTYIEIPELDSLLELHPKGFVLCGGPGIGKTTFLQRLAYKQTKKVFLKPKTELIPILINASSYTSGTMPLEELLWQKIISFSKIHLKIYNKWLNQNRILLLIDSLDASQYQDNLILEIHKIKKEHPGIIIIITSRNNLQIENNIKRLDLPIIQFPKLSKFQADKILSFLKSNLR